MGIIKCDCGRQYKVVSYKIKPTEDYLAVVLNYLEKCPFCKFPVLELKRLDKNNNVTTIHKNKKAAIKLYEKLKPNIIGTVKMQRSSL